MPYISIDGCNLYYEELGHGVPVVLTPGFLSSIDAVRPLGEQLASDFRVIMWDRSNLGRSDVKFKGSRDLDMWSDQLYELLYKLDAAPAYLCAASSGARVSYRTALRYPEVVKALFIWLVTGGSPISERLGQNYYAQYAELAETGGMEAVMSSPFWSERIRANPANRGRMLSTDPQEFIRTLRRWVSFMRPDDPIIGVTADDLREMKMPVGLVAGVDNNHRRDRSDLVAGLLPNVEYLEPAGFAEQWAPLEALRAYEAVPMMPDLIRAFVKKREASPATSA